MRRLQPSRDPIARSISFATSIPITPGNMATLSRPISSLNFSACTALGAVTNPSTWASFGEACEYLANEQADGVGFVLTGDDPFVVVDLDDCLDPETKELDEEAWDYLKALDSYAEVSPSGTGVHIWVEGTVPGSVRKDGVEVYSTRRFMTVTGRRLSKPTPADINKGGSKLQTLYQTVAGTERPSAKQQTPQRFADQELQRVIRQVRESRDAEKFDLLWAGSTDGYSSQSEADLALCRLLALHSGCREEMVDALFRQSQLFRDKWDEVRSAEGLTYGQMTIAKALVRAMDELKRKWAVQSGEDVVRLQPDRGTDYLVEGLIPRRSLGIVVGHWNVGKSPLLYQAGICVGAGIPFLGRKVQQGRALYLDFENGAAQSAELIRRITSHLGLSQPPDNFLVWNLNAAEGNWQRNRPTDIIRSFKPDLAILDSLTAFSPKIENRNSNATQVVLKLRQLSGEVGSAIWGTHHLAKPSPRKDRMPEPLEKCTNVRNWLFQARGASALVNATDVRIGVEEPLQRSTTETGAGEKEEIALVMRGFMRVAGEIPLVYVARVFDQQGEPLGYRQVTGSRLLFNSDQESVFTKLSTRFRFKDAQLAYNRGPQGTSDFLKKCVALQILRKT